MSRILLTGATGFIGRRLAQKVAQTFAGDEIIALIKADGENELERTGREVLRSLGIATLEVDLLTGEGLRDVPKSPDVVFHLASCTDMSVPDHRINDVGTRNLLESLGPIKPSMHFIFASTIAIHDNRPDFSRPVTESTPYPSYIANEYGRSKYRTLQYLKAQSHSQGFSLSTVRVSGVYGENTRPTGLYDMVGKLCERGSFISRINWPGRIAMIYVSDIANVFMEVALQKGKGEYFEVIPVVESLSLSELCKYTYVAMGKGQPKSIHLPRWFWSLMTLIAGKKALFEKVLPHKAYNRLWQLFVLSNNEFYNESLTLSSLFGDYPFMRFNEYIIQRIQGPSDTVMKAPITHPD